MAKSRRITAVYINQLKKEYDRMPSRSNYEKLQVAEVKFASQLPERRK